MFGMMYVKIGKEYISKAKKFSRSRVGQFCQYCSTLAIFKVKV